ncbi:MAG TPA: acetylxylan esterase [Myxococcaceae bacterium]|nr:acetylxylan esterase [Myxococcaceae bacterium]
MHLLLSLLVLASPGDAGAAAPAPRPLSFEYDAHQPLDVKDTVVGETPEATIHDVTFASANQQRVAAYLVVPKGKGPFAPIVFGHWGGGSRAEFIPEAKLYARAGAISILPDYPWDRAEPYRRTTNHFDKPEQDRDTFAQAVIDLRRAIDLLLARKDVDPKRLAYVGHSYGAQWGAILTAVDRRMRTALLVTGVGEIGDVLIKNPDPELAELRKALPAGVLDRYVRVVGEVDAIHFIPRAPPIPVLMQFARFEEHFDRESANRYIAAAGEPKKVLWYDSAHDMNEPQALRDRYAWLVGHVGLKAGLTP